MTWTCSLVRTYADAARTAAEAEQRSAELPHTMHALTHRDGSPDACMGAQTDLDNFFYTRAMNIINLHITCVLCHGLKDGAGCCTKHRMARGFKRCIA